jgi:hypothetical protein
MPDINVFRFETALCPLPFFSAENVQKLITFVVSISLPLVVAIYDQLFLVDGDDSAVRG